MNEEQLKKLLEMNESNQELEVTMYETQKSLSIIATQYKYLFDEFVDKGFTEDQAITLTLGTFTASCKK